MIDTKKIRNKHGFTLVEIIVVLVILAILAAVAIPSVLGYVDEAKKAGIIQEAHGIYEATQIAATKCYATDENQFLNIATHYLQIFLIKKQQTIKLEECLIL